MGSASQSLVNDLCGYADEILEPIGVQFALVMWLDGRPGDANAICVGAPPRAEADVREALATAVGVIGLQ